MRIWLKQTMTAVGAISLLTLPTAAFAAPHVTLNGTPQVYDPEPYQKNGRTLVPMRAIFEALGATVEWDETTKTVTGVQGETKIVLQVGSTTATVNGQPVILNQAAEQTNDRVMVPVRLISEALGAEVQWDETTETVRIYSKDMKDRVLHLGISDSISSLDPALLSSYNDYTVAQQVHEGLVRLDRDGNLVPGVAKAWDVSYDGLRYTFHLRDNAKWSDGSPVTAQDFEQSWKRQLNPETASMWSFEFFAIEGAEKYDLSQGGKADDVEVHAKDDRTLEVQLAKPQAYFLRQVALPFFAPSKTTTEPLYNGPFKAERVQYDQGALLVKNEQYWDRDHVRLQQIDFEAVPDTESAGRAYESGWLDGYNPLPQGITPEMPGSVVQTPPLSTVHYLEFNEQKVSALQNVKIRRALTYALDNQEIAEAVFGLSASGANGFVPTGVSKGAPSSGKFRDTAGDALHQAANASQAKTLFQEGLKELGLTALPNVKLLINDTMEAKKTAALLIQAWHDKLGVDVEAEYLPFKLVLQKQTTKDFDITLSGWGADYDDPMTFLDMWVTGGSFNNAGYSNAKYDALVDQIHKEADDRKRTDEMVQAEKLLLDDMAVGPVYFRNSVLQYRPYIKGLAIRSLYPMYDLKDAYIEGKN
ncbi:ABC transporter substrate-binding protein [Tumebacillus flagellatus]|uniref:Solute-binding protein family 5 domain-containing protein n=1 Tax=Tumebacillus flagellatus TaxID=1157490 RepID=A0A074LMZ2_9BACL|nr:ABC transporter substrate-binding protein [Tumebacillus flagellatus]KEO82489.1 hypothetical protein EL26_14710 [Tumebacillus flagellatus]